MAKEVRADFKLNRDHRHSHRSPHVKPVICLRAIALAGCLWWQEEGLEPPAKVEEATAHYRAAMDTLSDFLHEYFEEDASAVTTFSSIYDCYLKWSAANNERAETRQKLGSLLTNRGFKTTTLSRSKDRARKGLRLKEAV